MKTRGPALRTRREEHGLTLEEVADATRIPLEHLKAIEEGRPADLPDGPYAEAYLRTLEDHLDVPLGDAASRPSSPPDPGLPLWAVRWLAAASVLIVFGTVAWQTWKPNLDGGASDIEPEVAAVSREVKITPRKTTHLKVMVDDEIEYDGKVANGKSLTFAGADRVSVDVRSVEAVRIQYDGATIVPQGRQDAPRKLVFIDDMKGDR